MLAVYIVHSNLCPQSWCGPHSKYVIKGQANIILLYSTYALHTAQCTQGVYTVQSQGPCRVLKSAACGEIEELWTNFCELGLE